MNAHLTHFSKSLVAAICGVAVCTLAADADASRSASLAESRLITDKNDVYLFPQLSPEHTNLVSVDYGFSDEEGSGLVLFGDETRAIGAGIFRGDLLGERSVFPHDVRHRNLGNVDNLLERRADDFNDVLAPGDQLITPDLMPPHTIVDLFGSIEAGDGLLGVRLSVGHGATVETDIEGVESGDGQTFGGLTVGYSLLGDVDFDAAANFQLGSGGIFDDGDIMDGSFFHAGLSTRTYVEADENVEVGILGDLHYSTASFTEYIPDPAEDTVEQQEASWGEFATFAGAGPVYGIADSTISAYGVLGFARQSIDPDEDEADNRVVTSNTILPGFHIAADVEVVEWLYFRTGAQYFFGIESLTAEVDDPDAERNEVTQSTRGGGFGWRAGIGLEIDNFTLDGTFQSGFLTNGPSFLGGALGDADDDEVGMFTMVSAGYRF